MGIHNSKLDLPPKPDETVTPPPTNKTIQTKLTANKTG